MKHRLLAGLWAMMLAAVCSPAKDLYVLAATSSQGNFPSAAHLLRVEGGKVIPTKEVLSSADGLMNVLQSFQGRRLVLVTYMHPQKAVIVDLDNPKNSSKVDLGSEDSRTVPASYLVQDPVLGLRFVGLRPTAVRGLPEVIRIQLDEQRPAVINEKSSGIDALKFAEFTGTSGVAGLGFHDVGLAEGDASTGALSLYRTTGQFSIPLPSALRSAAGGGTRITIHVKNNDLLVLTETHTFEDAIAGKKATGLWYQHRPSGAWRTIETSGKPEIRGFGRWFTFTERKVDWVMAGRAQRQRNLTEKEFRDLASSRPKPSRHPEYGRATGPDIQVKFQNHELDGMPWNYTGVFRIVDSANFDREWSLDTGNENSEILLIEAQRILYRIEDAIWEATLDSTGKVTGQTKLAQDSRLLDVHWAFFSNSKMPGVPLSVEPGPFPASTRRSKKQ